MTTSPHASLAGADLHEPKGIASATSGQVYVANGSSSGAWTDQVVFSYPTLHIAGLIPTNASGDPTNDITITTGTCRDIVDTSDMVLAAGLTKRLDASWTVGDNQGGLDAGSIADTTYHIFLIKRTDTGVVDALFSTSATAPTMPSNYTKKRRIGSFRRISAAIQTMAPLECGGGSLEVLITPVADGVFSPASGSNTYTFAAIPSGVNLHACNVIYSESVSGALMNCTALDQGALTNGAPMFGGSGTLSISGDTVQIGSGKIYTRTNTSGQMRVTGTNGVTPLHIYSLGWVDHRRI